MLRDVSWHAHTITRLELQVPPSHELISKRAYGNKAYTYNQKRGDFDVSTLSQWAHKFVVGGGGLKSLRYKILLIVSNFKGIDKSTRHYKLQVSNSTLSKTYTEN